jgi:ribosomal protein L11 methyltransferase
VAVSVTCECNRIEKDLVAAEFCGAGTLGVIEEDLPDGRCLLKAFFEDHAEASALAARLAPHSVVVRQETTEDWVRVAQDQWQPLLAGQRFFLAPPWCHEPAPPGRFRLPMPPGTASGTGIHPATQLALEALERSMLSGDCVLDLGTGSGILSAGARLLGAGQVIACDIDEEAVAAAREYLGPSVAVFVGSARSLRRRSMDCVVANINVAAIASLLAEIARVLKPKGRAILGGFTNPEVRRLDEPLRAAGLALSESVTRDEWVCLITLAET